jgi:hypothetical protein
LLFTKYSKYRRFIGQVNHVFDFYDNSSAILLCIVFILRYTLFPYRMAGLQLLSEYGLRVDGRRPNELRQIRCKLGVFNQPDGSAYLEQGNTKVLAAVYGPHEVIFWLASPKNWPIKFYYKTFTAVFCFLHPYPYCHNM